MKKITILFLLLHVVGLKAQIANEIMAYTDSSEIIMSNGKKLMMESLQNKEYSKVSDVYFYLQEEAVKQGFLAFSYTDILYINLLSLQWGEFLDYARNYESKISLPVYQEDQQLTQRLFNLTNDNADITLQSSQNAQLSQEDIDLIEIYLYVIQEENLEKKYNSLISDYKSEYKNSKYQAFIEKYLPSIPRKISWGSSLGTTIISPQGNYGENFYTNAVFFVSLDFNIERVYGSLYINSGNLQVEKAFSTENVSFNKYDNFSYFDGGLQLGFFIVNTKRIHIAPYGTIAGSSLKSNIYDYENEHLELEVLNSFVYGAGVHTEVKLYETELSNLYSAISMNVFTPNISIKHYLALKINIGYNILSNSRYSISKGNVLYSQIGVVWGLGDF